MHSVPSPKLGQPAVRSFLMTGHYRYPSGWVMRLDVTYEGDHYPSQVLSVAEKSTKDLEGHYLLALLLLGALLGYEALEPAAGD